MLLYLLGFNFITNTDTGWYYKIVNEPLSFDPAIQPLYPLLVRLFIELSANLIGDYLIMNLVNLTFLIGFVIILNKIFEKLYNEFTALDIVFVFSLPFFSWFMTFMPRANSLLYFIEFSIIYLLLKNKRDFIFYFLVSLLPLVHKSSAFFILALVLYEILNKSFNIKKYILASIPFVVYLLLGSFLMHDDLLWWFVAYQDSSGGFNLPVFNGVADNFYFGLAERRLIDLAQVGLITVIYLLYFYFLIRGIRKKNYEAILFYLPGLLILPLLPKSEINAFVNYSFFGFFGLYVDVRKMNIIPRKTIKYLTFILVVTIQLGYCFYSYTVLK